MEIAAECVCIEKHIYKTSKKEKQKTVILCLEMKYLLYS